MRGSLRLHILGGAYERQPLKRSPLRKAHERNPSVEYIKGTNGGKSMRGSPWMGADYEGRRGNFSIKYSEKRG